MEIIFATGNKTKAKRFSESLLKRGITVKSLKDINIELDVVEDGNSPMENALIKARECYKKTGKSVIGMDDSLYLEGVPDEMQPGLYVRRVNGQELSDEEMIEHYVGLVKKYGMNGRINCKWVYCLAVINEQGEEATYTWSKDDIYMVDEVSNIINPGYPLNSITKYKEIDKYLTDATEEDKAKLSYSEEDVAKFIAMHV